MKQWPTILLVEDESAAVDVFEQMLRDYSIAAQLRQVADGCAALAYLKGEGHFSNRKIHPMPGMVVLDLFLPGLGGLAVLSWIRQQPWLHGLPVVVFTSSDEERSLAAAMSGGADTYILKGRETRGLMYLLANTNLNWGIIDDPAPPSRSAPR